MQSSYFPFPIWKAQSVVSMILVREARQPTLAHISKTVLQSTPTKEGARTAFTEYGQGEVQMPCYSTLP